MYTTPSGRTVHIAAQYNLESGSCGGGVALMIALDILSMRAEKIILEPEFKNRYITASFLQATQIVFDLETQRIVGKVKTYALKPVDLDHEVLQVNESYKEAVLEDIQKTIEETGHSVILGITHKIIKGHWIIIDEVTEDEVFIRDPYTIKAYRIPKMEFLQDVFRKVVLEHSVYFPKIESREEYLG